MSDAVLNSQFLTRLLTSGEEDFECVSLLKGDTSITAYMLISSISVTFSETSLTVLITKSCQ